MAPDLGTSRSPSVHARTPTGSNAIGTGFVWHERYMWQEAGGRLVGYDDEIEKYMEPGQYWLGPDPKRRIRNLLEVSGMLAELTPVLPRPATAAEIGRVHSEDYIRAVETACRTGGGMAGPGTVLGPDSFEIALLAAGGVIAAVDAVLDGEIENAYALVRPPGHHAIPNQGLGLCIFGNVAVAVKHLLEVRGLDRVAVVDWDVHHGNGTQEIFYDDPTVLTISLHQANAQIGKSVGSLDERGEGEGTGYNLNIPLPPGSGNGAYMAAMERLVVPMLRHFEPQFILIACGLDANILDPGGRMMLKPETYRQMTQRLLETAREFCEGRVVAAHEGGYSEVMSPFCALAAIATLRGIRSEVEDLVAKGFSAPNGEPDQDLQRHQAEVIERADRMIAKGDQCGRHRTHSPSPTP